MNEPENLNSFFLKDPQTKNGSTATKNNLFTILKSALSNGIRDIIPTRTKPASARYTELAKASAVASRYGRNEEDIAVLMAEFDPAELEPEAPPLPANRRVGAFESASSQNSRVE